VNQDTSGSTPPGDREQLETFYRDAILEHSVNPVGFRRDLAATHQNEQYNPLCGDRIRLAFVVADGTVEDCSFDGEACAICMASASMLCEHTSGRDIAEVIQLQQSLEQALAGQTETLPVQALNALLGARRYPSRIRCALLPWIAAIKALETNTPPDTR